MGRVARVAANDDVRLRQGRIVALPPRALRREDAAAYVAMSGTKFDQLVSDGRMPKPFRVDGCVLWDVRKLDLAYEVMAGDDGGGNPWE